jgi:integrase
MLRYRDASGRWRWVSTKLSKENLAARWARLAKGAAEEAREGTLTPFRANTLLNDFRSHLRKSGFGRQQSIAVKEWFGELMVLHPELAGWLTEFIKKHPGVANRIILKPDPKSVEYAAMVNSYKHFLDQLVVSCGYDVAKCSIEQFFQTWESSMPAFNLAPGTAAAYAGVMKSFLDYLGPRKRNPLESLSPDHFRSYRDSLRKDRHVSKETTNKHLRILARILETAVEDDKLDRNWAKRVEPLQVESRDRQKRREFTERELELTLKASDREWEGMILFSLWSGGARLADVANLRESNINEHTKECRLIERKTRHENHFPLELPLLRWLEGRTITDDVNRPLFPTLCGKSPGWLSRQFRKILVKAGFLPKIKWKKRSKVKTGRRPGSRGPKKLAPLSFHSLRHTASTWADRLTENPNLAQAITGHKSAAVAARYRHYGLKEKSKVLSKFPDIKRNLQEPQLGYEP